ncbi:hypothetical protein RCC89_01025 [Cytophagaceae bacterium ABcell3]|nr:hypothetical protein RCC89_01025 [Cytophagaceae bacterium ABcell3]
MLYIWHQIYHININPMVVLGVILTVVGFIAGVGGGLVLSDASAMIKEDGQVDKEKETKIAVFISICAIMIIVGTLMFVRNYV